MGRIDRKGHKKTGRREHTSGASALALTTTWNGRKAAQEATENCKTSIIGSIPIGASQMLQQSQGPPIRGPFAWEGCDWPGLEVANGPAASDVAEGYPRSTCCRIGRPRERGFAGLERSVDGLRKTTAGRIILPAAERGFPALALPLTQWLRPLSSGGPAGSGRHLPHQEARAATLISGVQAWSMPSATSKSEWAVTSERERDGAGRVQQRDLDAVGRGERPFFQWTLIAATIMTGSSRAGPIGPRRPSAIRIPLAASLTEAMVTKRRPGRKPSCSKTRRCRQFRTRRASRKASGRCGPP